MRVFLDSNIVDLLAEDISALERLRDLSAGGRLEAISTPKLIDELSKKPWHGVPPWLPTTYEPEAVSVLGHMFLGQSFMTRGEIYTEHLGESSQVADAIHAESASFHANVFVSEDRRAVRRLNGIDAGCRAMDYQKFRVSILGLPTPKS